MLQHALRFKTVGRFSAKQKKNNSIIWDAFSSRVCNYLPFKRRELSRFGYSRVGMMLLCGLFMASTSHAKSHCKANIAKTAPDSRYTVISGGSEVKDKQTGLIWQRCSLGQSWDGTTCSGTASAIKWSQALSQVQDLGKGYRLPNIKELQSLAEDACINPLINETIFPNTNLWYWSASPDVKRHGYAWGMDFQYGVVHYAGKSGSKHVRAVR